MQMKIINAAKKKSTLSSQGKKNSSLVKNMSLNSDLNKSQSLAKIETANMNKTM